MADIFKKAQKTTVIAALITILFALTKAIVGLISGSVVLLADAVHSAADSFSTFAAWFGLKIAQKKPNQKFPYGYYKAESLTALLISGLILFAAYSIIRESLAKFFVEPQLNIPLIAIGVAVLDAAVMFLVGSYEVKVGKEINSQSLIADGRESKMHLFSSSIVTIGLFSAFFKIPYLEGAMGILISLFIFKVGLESAKDSIMVLMDVSPNLKIERKIRTILETISGIKGFENLKLRKSGPFIFGEVTIKIRKNVNVNKAYEISSRIEKEIKKKIKAVDSFIITVLPYQTKKQKFCIPIEEDKGLESSISSRFGKANKFIFVNIDNNNIENYYVKENPCKHKKMRIGLGISDFVIREKVDSIITKEIGPISLHTLRDHIVDVYKGKDGTIKEIIKHFPEQKLELLEEPTKEK